MEERVCTACGDPINNEDFLVQNSYFSLFKDEQLYDYIHCPCCNRDMHPHPEIDDLSTCSSCHYEFVELHDLIKHLYTKEYIAKAISDFKKRRWEGIRSEHIKRYEYTKHTLEMLVGKIEMLLFSKKAIVLARRILTSFDEEKMKELIKLQEQSDEIIEQLIDLVDDPSIKDHWRKAFTAEIPFAVFYYSKNVYGGLDLTVLDEPIRKKAKIQMDSLLTILRRIAHLKRLLICEGADKLPIKSSMCSIQFTNEFSQTINKDYDYLSFIVDGIEKGWVIKENKVRCVLWILEPRVIEQMKRLVSILTTKYNQLLEVPDEIVEAIENSNSADGNIFEVVYLASKEITKTLTEITNDFQKIGTCPECSSTVYINEKHEYVCLNCKRSICKTCFKAKEPNHKCKRADIDEWEFMLNETKPCPTCGFRFGHHSACETMFCINCHHYFNYRTGEAIKGHPHNPEVVLVYKDANKHNRKLMDAWLGIEPLEQRVIIDAIVVALSQSEMHPVFRWLADSIKNLFRYVIEEGQEFSPIYEMASKPKDHFNINVKSVSPIIYLEYLKGLVIRFVYRAFSLFESMLSLQIKTNKSIALHGYDLKLSTILIAYVEEIKLCLELITGEASVLKETANFHAISMSFEAIRRYISDIQSAKPLRFYRTTAFVNDWQYDTNNEIRGNAIRVAIDRLGNRAINYRQVNLENLYEFLVQSFNSDLGTLVKIEAYISKSYREIRPPTNDVEAYIQMTKKSVAPLTLEAITGALVRFTYNDDGVIMKTKGEVLIEPEFNLDDETQAPEPRNVDHEMEELFALQQEQNENFERLMGE